MPKPRSRHPLGRNRKLSVRAVRREEPDLKKFSRALLYTALKQQKADKKARPKDGI